MCYSALKFPHSLKTLKVYDLLPRRMALQRMLDTFLTVTLHFRICIEQFRETMLPVNVKIFERLMHPS